MIERHIINSLQETKELAEKIAEININNLPKVNIKSMNSGSGNVAAKMFKNEFDKKRLSVIKKYEDSSDENVVVWIASTSEEKLSKGIRIRINMDCENRTCFLFGGPGGTYNYVGK